MRSTIILVLAVASACGGGGGSRPPLSSDPVSVYLQQTLAGLIRIGGGAAQLFPMALAPGQAAASGVEFAPAATPGTYTFRLPVDTDGDGTTETVMTGSVSLSGGLFSFGLGFGGTATLTIDRAGEQTVTANVEFLATPEGIQVSGTATLLDTVAGTTSVFTVAEKEPMLLSITSGDADGMANLCDFSAEGSVHVAVEGPTDSYEARWSFQFDRRTVHVTDAVSVDAQGVPTELEDSSFEVDCDSGSIQDWAGTYDFNWFCNPEEEGDSEMIVTVTGPNTIRIQDDPGDDLVYDATAVPGNPHIVRGFFIDNGYREDFTWTLSADGKTFTQHSAYVFLPPLTGGGLCGGVGTKR